MGFSRLRSRRGGIRTYPYIGEFRWHWPNLIGASLGVAMGSALSVYIFNLFGPPLIDEFGWQKSQFALVSSLALISLIFFPLAGRFVDRFGSRVAAIIGYTTIPLCFFAFSLMSGSILEFYAISLVKNVFGTLTSSLVFGRVIVERFDVARGLALSIVMSGPPLVGAIGAPVVGEVIDSEGWRAGFRMLAIMSAVGGLFAVVLIGVRKRDAPMPAHGKGGRKHLPLTRKEFFALVRQPVFFLLIGGMFLINIPQVILSSQMKLVLYESGATSSFATWLVSVFAIAVMVGRFLSGYALDRISPHIVGACTLGLPAIGLFALASPLDASWMLIAAIALAGVGQGAEGDVGAILISRKFDIRHYSFIYSFLIVGMSAATAIGSLILSYMLHRTDTYADFLVLGGVVTLVGVICFYLTGRFGGADASQPGGPVG